MVSCAQLLLQQCKIYNFALLQQQLMMMNLLFHIHIEVGSITYCNLRACLLQLAIEIDMIELVELIGEFEMAQCDALDTKSIVLEASQ
jgi:hypothetical protein